MFCTQPTLPIHQWSSTSYGISSMYSIVVKSLNYNFQSILHNCAINSTYPTGCNVANFQFSATKKQIFNLKKDFEKATIWFKKIDKFQINREKEQSNCDGQFVNCQFFFSSVNFYTELLVDWLP